MDSVFDKQLIFNWLIVKKGEINNTFALGRIGR
jgi:hypothetical protein